MFDVRSEFQKTPAEAFDIDVSFDQSVPPGANSISSGTLSATKWPRRQPTLITDATNEILFSTSAIVVGRYNRKIRIRVTGGTDDYDYQIKIFSNWNNNAVLEADVFLKVRIP